MSEKAATTMYVTCGNGNMYVCIYTLGAFYKQFVSSMLETRPL